MGGFFGGLMGGGAEASAPMIMPAAAPAPVIQPASTSMNVETKDTLTDTATQRRKKAATLLGSAATNNEVLGSKTLLGN